MDATAQLDRAFTRSVSSLESFFAARLEQRGGDLVEAARAAFPEAPGRVVRRVVEERLDEERAIAASELKTAERGLSAALADPHPDLRTARVRSVLTRQRDRWADLEAAGDHRVLEMLSARPWGRRS